MSEPQMPRTGSDRDRPRPPHLRAHGMDPLRQLKECGQSLWLDYLKRSTIAGGELHAAQAICGTNAGARDGAGVARGETDRARARLADSGRSEPLTVGGPSSSTTTARLVIPAAAAHRQYVASQNRLGVLRGGGASDSAPICSGVIAVHAPSHSAHWLSAERISSRYACVS